MTPHVSTSEPEFDPIADAIAKMDVTPLKDFIDAHVKRGYDELTTLLWDAVETNLASDSSANLTYRAAAVAERYIAEALAGDDARLRQIFGISGIPQTSWALVQGRYGSSGNLFRELVIRHPDVLRDEVVKELGEEVAALKDELAKLKTRRVEEGW